MIVGISGYIGVGKDTVAKMIQLFMLYSNPTPHTKRTIESWRSNGSAIDFVREWMKPVYTDKNFPNEGYWEIKKFAGKLKEICSLLTGIPVADFELESVKDSFLGPEWDKWYVEKFGLIEAFRPHDWERQNAGPRHYNKPFSIEQECRDWWESLVANGNHVLGNPYLGDVRYTVDRMKVRTLLQLMGTDAMRNQVHPNVHINALFADYKPTKGNSTTKEEYSAGKPLSYDMDIYPNWIISDLRFPNEFDAIKQRGGITVRVERKPKVHVLIDTDSMTPGAKHAFEEFLKPHESEIALDGYKFDYTINNNGTMEELLVQVEQMLKESKLL